jgi:hypothetical protein
MEQFTDLRSNVLNQSGLSKWFTELGEAYEMLAETESYKKKMRRKHHERGAFRSGEGTPEQIY